MTQIHVTPLLERVEKPARYLGNEMNSVHKELSENLIRFAWCFPDIYEIGMSHLGSIIMYHRMNDMADVFCERCYMPASDMEQAMKANNIPLFSLESRTPVKEFDMIGFTLQYELTYTNILQMLSLAGIPHHSSQRNAEDPLVVMGGPCAANPAPLADFADLFVIGETEEAIEEILSCYRKHRRDKASFLREASRLEGVYVPSVQGDQSSSPPVRKRVIRDLDAVYFPVKPLIPYMDIVHDRASLELFRGCIRGCRFCQAGYLYRPFREKHPDTLLDQASQIIGHTGYEEISLTSLSTSDYSSLTALTRKLTDTFAQQHVSLSLPSLRLDNTTLDILEEVQKIRKSGLTFAPEAATHRLRCVINKGLTDRDLLETVRNAYQSGWSQIKLYFMIGLPTETMEDVKAIYQLVSWIDHEVYHQRDRTLQHPLKLSVSVSNFVPKPFTPFQWVAQESRTKLKEKQQCLRDLFRQRKAFQFSYHDVNTSFLEAVFSRGDSKLSEVLANAVQKDCRFDGWAESFQMERWLEAFEEAQVDPSFYANRERQWEEPLPWDHIDIGVKRSFLWREYQKALRGETTAHCRDQCHACGYEHRSMGGLCP